MKILLPLIYISSSLFFMGCTSDFYRNQEQREINDKRWRSIEDKLGLEAPSDASVKPRSRDDFEEVFQKVNNSPVIFKLKATTKLGKVADARIRINTQKDETGTIVNIEWEDNSESIILFTEDQRARIWQNSNEYSGDWAKSSDGRISIYMNQGGIYTFSSLQSLKWSGLSQS